MRLIIYVWVRCQLRCRCRLTHRFNVTIVRRAPTARYMVRWTALNRRPRPSVWLTCWNRRYVPGFMDLQEPTWTLFTGLPLPAAAPRFLAVSC